VPIECDSTLHYIERRTAAIVISGGFPVAKTAFNWVRVVVRVGGFMSLGRLNRGVCVHGVFCLQLFFNTFQVSFFCFLPYNVRRRFYVGVQLELCFAELR